MKRQIIYNYLYFYFEFILKRKIFLQMNEIIDI